MLDLAVIGTMVAAVHGERRNRWWFFIIVMQQSGAFCGLMEVRERQREGEKERDVMVGERE